MNLTHLSISWSTSRGRDTYGYNICRLDDGNTGQRYKCNGGGYDMVGTVFGDWLADKYQDRLQALSRTDPADKDKLYGMGYQPEGKVRLDGACGIESMLGIAEAIGLEVQREHNRKGHTTGYFVEEKLQVTS